MRRARPALILALAGLTVACAHYAPLDPLNAEHTVANLDPDEQHLWKQSREIQHEIGLSGLLYEEPALDAYLGRMLEHVKPPELVQAGLEPRVQVISDEQMHAYSFANGVIYIHTGLAARLENETELATVLTRELAHVTYRHKLRSYRDNRATADMMAWMGVGSTLVEGGGNAKLLAQAALMSSSAGFHHVLETQADERGLAGLYAAGYDVHGAPDFFRMTVDYQRELHSQGQAAWLPFSPPPQMTARINGYEKILAEDYVDRGAQGRPLAERDAFHRLLHGATRRQAELELASGLFLSAEKTARLATESRPDDPEAWILLGQALQGQRDKTALGHKPPPIRDVRAAYEKALEADGQHPVATRELGMSFYRKTGPERTPEARGEALRHLRRYLALAPDAEDEEYVRGYLRELESEQR